MENKLIATLQQIMDLSLTALTEAKRQQEKTRQKIKLLQGNFMPRKKILPPNVREFRKDYYQARKTVDGVTYSAYSVIPEQAAEKLNFAILNREPTPKPIEVVPPKALTFGDWLIRWLEQYKKPKLALSSFQSLESCIRLHIPDHLKSFLLIDLKPADIDKALFDVPSSRQRQITSTVYNMSLVKAYKLGLINDNLADRIDDVTHEYINGIALTISEQTAFISALEGHTMKYLFICYLNTGCRLREALALKWEDIDREHGRLFINGTKTKTAKRFIPLFPSLISCFDSIQKQASSPYIFHVTPSAAQKAINVLCPAHTIKDLRCTFGTRARESGVDIEVVAKWLGHAQVSTTEKYYINVQDDYELKQADKFSLYPKVYPTLNPPKQ